jgi:hypothetical protein
VIYRCGGRNGCGHIEDDADKKRGKAYNRLERHVAEHGHARIEMYQTKEEIPDGERT